MVIMTFHFVDGHYKSISLDTTTDPGVVDRIINSITTGVNVNIKLSNGRFAAVAANVTYIETE